MAHRGGDLWQNPESTISKAIVKEKKEMLMESGEVLDHERGEAGTNDQAQ